MVKKAVGLFLILFLLGGLSALAAEKVVKVGVVYEQTGNVATFGQSAVNATKMAAEEINAKGGIKGVGRIELVIEDNKSDAAESANAYNKLIFKDKVVGILGPVTSTNTLAAGPIAQQAGIPVITPTSTNPRVTQVGDYIFRACFIDPFQGRVMAVFAAKELKFKRVAVMPEVTSDYAMGLCQFFKENFEKLGGKVVAEEKFSTGDQDFSAQLTKIKATNPDAIYVGSYYNDVALISRQARQLGINVPLIGGDGFDSPKLFEIGKEAVVGHYFTNHYSPDDQDPVTQKFVKAYKAKYGQTPDALAALGYDAANLLFDAIRRAGKADPKAIRDALAKTKGFKGVSGSITFDENRNPVKAAVILQVQKDGSQKFVKKVQP
ncbi:MAG: ABC transporter substrate-binding protein [Bacillota bacterium]|nr:ABC transporter substrate-binding protein [Bacillota bacterium]